MRRFTALVALLTILPGCASWPSFVALARDADRAYDDALVAIEQCRSVSDDTDELDACVSGVMEALATAGDAGLAVGRAVCDELETAGKAYCYREDGVPTAKATLNEPQE